MSFTRYVEGMANECQGPRYDERFVESKPTGDVILSQARFTTCVFRISSYNVLRTIDDVVVKHLET